MAVWVAVVSLGKLSDFASQGDSSSRSNKDGPNSALMALWALLLLLHLGGPDKITVFLVEEIHPWLRHLVGLLVQVALVIYIFLRCWTQHSHSPLILSIPMFVAGVIKYGERTWVLWAANSVFPGLRFPVKYDPYARARTLDQIGDNDPNLKFLVTSDYLLQTLAYLQEGDDELMNSGEVKANLTEVFRGTFSMIRKGAEYSKVDIDITYLLLVAAVLLEVYGLTLMISSEWMILWMLPLRCIQLRILAFLAVYDLKGRRWSGVVGQLDYLSLLTYPYQKKPSLVMLCARILNLLGMGYFKFRSFCCQSYVHDFDDMKIVILKWVRERVGKIGEIEPVGIGRPGVLALKRYGLLRHFEQPRKSSFPETVTLFHRVTEACYKEDDHSLEREGGDERNSEREASKLMSRYMFYFLAKYHYVFGGSVPLESYIVTESGRRNILTTLVYVWYRLSRNYREG
ncbi:hypothetical protein RJ640_029765 [Escallonia rubra]|uniref:DUF4220 domain-containing protein n=1 Tax=Escallonia rubra TaxID=112253 RepID=A0AA88UFK2_9ASTE|nr:hypothetical protein RJ640_029765 [Escallonia rubra]